MENTLNPIIITCSCCGAEFTFCPSEQQLFKKLGYKQPTRCPECRNKLKNEKVTITCKDCGKQFTIDGYEIQYFKKKGYALPIRCRECREYKKQRNTTD